MKNPATESIGDILKRKYGDDYFVKLAAVAGKAKNPKKGFGTTSLQDDAADWFKRGGQNSKRGLAAKWPRVPVPGTDIIVVAKTVRGKVKYYQEDGTLLEPQPEMSEV